MNKVLNTKEIIYSPLQCYTRPHMHNNEPYYHDQKRIGAQEVQFAES